MAKKKKEKKKSESDDFQNLLFSLKTKNGSARIAVFETGFKGNTYLQIVEQYLKDDGEWGFTKKNISMSLSSKDEKASTAEKFIKKFRKEFKPSKKGK